MTGFGREEKLINNKKIVIEIRTLNSKGLDINLRVHESFSFIGEYLRKSVKEKLIKGKVDIILDVEDTNEDLQIPFNKSKIKAYLKELRKDFNFNKSEEKKIKILLDKVIQKQLKYRKIEGKAIGDDLNKSISKINSYITKTISIESNRVEDKKKKFKSYFNELNEKFDKSRLEQEMIYYKFFSSEVKNKEIKGKKLSFICQEIGREINTIGSKANNFEIQSLVVNMKEELEKIKENILNIL